MAVNNGDTKDLYQNPPGGTNQQRARAEQRRSTKAKIQGASPEIPVNNAAAAVGVRWIIDDISPILAAITVLADVDDLASEDLAHRLYAIQKLARMGIRTVDDIMARLAGDRGAMQGEPAELDVGLG